MGTALRIAFACLGLLGGAIAGGMSGFLAGLGFTTLSGTSDFEGYSGFVIVYWSLGGLFLGAIAGMVIGLRFGGRRRRHPA